MSYQWKKDDIGVVQRCLRENNEDKSAATKALLEFMPSLKIEEIAIAIEIAEHERLFEKGQLSLEKLRESQGRLLKVNENKVGSYYHF